MERTYVKDLKNKIGEQVVVKGWVQTIRNQGSIKFLIIRDITGFIQAVALKSLPKAFAIAGELTLESVVALKGLVKNEAQAPSGIEIGVESIEILSKAAPELPIPVVVEKGGEESEANIRYDWRWLDLRKSDKQLIFKVWTELEKGFRDYWEKEGFIQIYTPSLMSTASESGAEVFEIKYFDKNAYLAKSPQFYKQLAMAAGLERVFITGPVYRAEPSFTTRHMTEFTGWDFEISYINSYEDVMAMEEKLLIAGFMQVKEKLGLAIDVPVVPFPKLTMKEIKMKLTTANIPSENEHDLSPEEEREICRLVKEETGHDFLFVTEWHKSMRAFYHMRKDGDNSITKGFDLLYKGLEITTGAQREHRLNILEKQALEKGMDLVALADYLNFFRYGCPPHGGAGIGPGRIIMKMLDLQSVKETAFLPRDVKRLSP